MHFKRLWDVVEGASGGDLRVGFWIEKIENFEKFANGPESIGDVFGECLGAFWCNFRHLPAVMKLIATFFMSFRCICVHFERLWDA